MRRRILNTTVIMQNIPQIMGLQMEFKGSYWQGQYYITGERHAYKRDKLKVKEWLSSEGCCIMVYEQGGQSLSLQTWLQTYGGAADYAHAMSIMQGFSLPDSRMPQPLHVEQSEIRYVSEAEYREFERNDLNDCKLYCYMCRLFGEERVRPVWERYRVTCDERGDVVFFYCDTDGRILHDKVMRYKVDGHRDKSFGGSRRFRTGDGYRARCLFGAHLIGEGEIHCVESEKTCLMAAIAMPDKVWVASGGKGQLRDVDENVLLYPDMDAILEWTALPNARICEWWIGEDVGEKDDLGDLIERKCR